MIRPSLSQQHFFIKNKFPSSSITYNHPKLIVNIKIKPNDLSRTYPVNIVYDAHTRKIKVFVKGNLQKLDRQDFPHIYAKDKKLGIAQICLFYPIEKEWTTADWISDTIIPWASEWLFYYELWLGTGEWFGEGIEHEEIKEN